MFLKWQHSYIIGCRKIMVIIKSDEFGKNEKSHEKDEIRTYKADSKFITGSVVCIFFAGKQRFGNRRLGSANY
jgi:hypothetical protein